MQVFLLIFLAAIAMTIAEKDAPWAWRDDDKQKNDDEQKEGRAADARYHVYEPVEHLGGFNGNQLGFRPQNSGPFGPNSRPIIPGYPGNNGVLVGPGGPTGIIGRPPRFELHGPDGIVDSVPPWIRDDPRYREFDTCKCRYSFNCPSPGLKFGHCAREKKYCCFNSRRFPGLLGGGHYPYYPGAPHRPNGFSPTSNYYGNRRPHGGFERPSFGDYYSGSYDGAYGHRNEFESYDVDPDDYAIYGRSLGKNQTQASEQPKKEASK